jgi:hypothetical protein
MNWKGHEKESHRGLTEILYRHVPGETQENDENSPPG